MTTAALELTTESLAGFRQRRQAGEKVSDLAIEAGLPWQKLDKLLRHGLPDVSRRVSTGESTVPPIAPPPDLHEALIKVFQPKTLGDILGQGVIVGYLRKFAANPHSASFLFEGGTGVGKTSTALALAAELGCDLVAGDLGGLRVVASGEQTADAVREAVSFLHFIPMMGSGWKVLVVNEADRMSTAAETIWLDALERLPGRSLVIFTTNHVGKLSDRFQDRSLQFHFAGDVRTLYADAAKLLERVWRECTGRPIPGRTARRLLRAAERDRTLSFRRLLQLAEQELVGTEQPQLQGVN